MTQKGKGSGHNEWARHPYTKKMIEAVERRANGAMTNLMSACAKSSDPEVRAKHSSYLEAKGLAEAMASDAEAEE